MPNNYKVKVNKTLKIEISKQEVSELDIVKITKTKSHILQKKTPYKTEIVKANFDKKEYTVKVNSKTYKVKIEDELDTQIQKMGFTLGKAKKINEVKSPMPGLILEINVEEGQEVKENETILVLEAMKMENSITSPRDGKIKTIAIKKGEAVEKGVLLIEFE